MREAHGDTCPELLLLQKRIRVCTTLRRLAEAPKLHSVENFKQLVLSVKQFWDIMPLTLKVSITFSGNHVLLDSICSYKIVDDKDDEAQLTEKIVPLVDAHMLSVTAASWDGDDPQFSSILNEAFADLEQKTMDAATASTVDHDKCQDALNAAAQRCSGMLKDGFGWYGMVTVNG